MAEMFLNNFSIDHMCVLYGEALQKNLMLCDPIRSQEELSDASVLEWMWKQKKMNVQKSESILTYTNTNTKKNIFFCVGMGVEVEFPHG